MNFGTNLVLFNYDKYHFHRLNISLEETFKDKIAYYQKKKKKKTLDIEKKDFVGILFSDASRTMNITRNIFVNEILTFSGKIFYY